MQGETPLISVVVPAYNRESTIAQTLDSLLAQTHRCWEVIVVDDGSSDATAERVEEYARRDERVRIYRQANKGVSAARNAGIARASHPWLFFLDADDWIVPTAFAALLQASSSSDEIDAVYAGYVRVDEKGRETRERRPAHAEDLFPAFTQMCAFAIHACLVRTDLVRAVDGFDETLVTCEDWDLWQRIARSGARFATIPDYIAYYRMRAKSASANGARMLEDGLKVIARGHAEDQRLTDVNPLHRSGAADSAKPLTQVYFVCYAAALAMSQGEDARWMLDALDDSRPPGIDAGGVAETLFLAVPNGRAANPEEWPEFPPAVLERCREFIDALSGWMGDKWLAFGARRALERLMLGVVAGSESRTVGGWHLTEIDCAGDPPLHLCTGAEVERVICAVRFGAHDLGAVELAACDGWIPPRVLADRIAEEFAWDLVGLLLARDIHPQLEIDRAGAAVRVARNGVTLAEGEAPTGSGFDEWLRGQVDWTLLLQEVLGNDTWTGEDFYSDRPQPRTRPRRKTGDAPVAVELSEPLPSIYCRKGVTIGATLAGVPLLTLRLRARRGRVQAHQIRKAVLTRLGFELCRAVIREWILAPAATGLSLREALAAAARGRSSAKDPATAWAPASRPRDLVPGWHGALAEIVPAGGAVLLIGRRASGAEGTSVSRYAVLPAAPRAEMLAAALQDDDPALEVGDGERGCVAYAPCLQWDRSSAGHCEADDASLLTGLESEQNFATRAKEDVPPAVAEPKLPILMYHRIATEGAEKTKRWRTHPDDFRRQLEFLRAAGYYSLSFEEWRAALNTRRVLPGKPIVITFDDGYEEFHREVAPLLTEHGFRASVFIVSELVGQVNAWDEGLGETLSLMDWPEIEQLASEGFEIGSHTRRHLPLVTLDKGRLADDLTRSKRTLEQHLGQPVRSLSYPFGLHDATVESVAGACGYEHAVTTDEWLASWSDSLLALPRLEVAGTDSIDDFAAMLRR